MVNSRFTGDDVAETLGVDPDRIHVAYPGVGSAFTPAGPKTDGDYVLAVGTLEPRKNLDRIARAVDGEVRVAGGRGWGGVEAPLNVTWLPNTTDEELAALYRGARCLVYASLYEGFGIPVAEALACGCPIVTSAGSPMAALVGDDAVLVDPTDVAAIKDAIGRAVAPAPRRVADWDDVAARTLGVYEEAAS
jgi:glycosyltransferase involved in cell wall biosynthesis